MKKTFLLFVILICSANLKAQNKKEFQYLKNPVRLGDIERINSTQNVLTTAAILFPFNPIFIFEDKKFYVGLTKEVSIGKLAYGRIAFEYSLIFRETRVNHFRVSYNYDFPVETGDFAAFLFSAGGGYFTDFDKNGYFPQASFSVLLPVTEVAATSVYLKVRQTIMSDKSKPDIFDISLGLATVIYF